MRYLHERLHSFREAIMGENMRNASYLRREINRLMPIAQRDDLQSYNELLEIQKQLETLKDRDMRRRTEIDQLVCKILNDQEQRLLKQGGWTI